MLLFHDKYYSIQKGDHNMSNKRTSFEIDRALERIISPSVFDRIIKEVNPDEIPVDYIQQILVTYQDGTTVELSGEEISYPVPVNKNANWENMDESFRKMKEVKIFVNTLKLETDINMLVEKYIGGKC